MLYCAVLCCAVLCCAVLCCAVLCCAVLCVECEVAAVCGQVCGHLEWTQGIGGLQSETAQKYDRSDVCAVETVETID